jgi:hypothetical protein
VLFLGEALDHARDGVVAGALLKREERVGRVATRGFCRFLLFVWASLPLLPFRDRSTLTAGRALVQFG